jgi:hypothetical protein
MLLGTFLYLKKKANWRIFATKEITDWGSIFLLFFKKLTFAKKKKRKEYSTPSAPTYTYYHSTVWGGVGDFSLVLFVGWGLFSNFASSKIWRIFPTNSKTHGVFTL